MPKSRIYLRPSVLDHYSVPRRGVEASNHSRGPVSSPLPLYHATRARCPVSLAGVPLLPSSRSPTGSRSNCAYTPPGAGVYATLPFVEECQTQMTSRVLYAACLAWFLEFDFRVRGSALLAICSTRAWSSSCGTTLNGIPSIESCYPLIGLK